MNDLPAYIASLLGRRINLPEIQRAVIWASGDESCISKLLAVVRAAEIPASVNALWVLTHLQPTCANKLQEAQNELIDMLLNETHTGRKRMLLQLMREQTYDSEHIRSDFLDFCLSKINSECEPYAIRAFSLYCAFGMCRFYPELVAELEQHLEMLELQSPSPGLMSAMRTVRKRIAKLRR